MMIEDRAPAELNETGGRKQRAGDDKCEGNRPVRTEFPAARDAEGDLPDRQKPRNRHDDGLWLE